MATPVLVARRFVLLHGNSAPNQLTFASSNARLKTYSRRVNGKDESHTGRKRKLDTISTVGILQDAVLPKIYGRGSIQNYFKPLPTPPPTSRPTTPDSKRLKTTLTSPLSTVASENRQDASLSGVVQQKKRRRLNARPQLAEIANISEGSSGRSPTEKKSTLQPRSPEGEQIVEAKQQTAASLQKAGKKAARTHQALLDISSSAFVECKSCKMQFNKTDKGDRAAHERFHLEFLNGKQSRSNNSTAIVYSESFSGEICGRKKASLAGYHEVCAVDRSSPPDLRTQSEAALELSYADMDGIRFEEGELWSEILNPQDLGDENKVARFKVFTYHINRELAAVLLAQRVALGSEQKHGNLTPKKRKVYLGIERIWVKKKYRGQGLGGKLLDIARETFVRGLVLSKKQMAFSAPTKDGSMFAGAYCRGVFPQASFLVYL